MKRTLSSLLLTICFCSIAFAQDDASDKTRKALADAARNGNGLHTQITVNGNVHAQAVLIPKVDARRIFGSEIANNYAVVEINVGNKSPDAALIIHGVFIDYSRWPLSGSTPSELNASTSTDSYQASTFPSQVASEEYRIVRGQLLDAQTDTLRNRFLRLLTLAGNLAGAFTFSLNEQGIVKGIAAATGVGIPGVATAWPDKTIDQLNRVSDFGFRSNKVIPKQASDVIVCFFPIDRFLTPGFRKLFLKSPALFFAPLQMLVDKKAEAEARAALGDLFAGFGFGFEELKKELPCYMTIRHPRANNPAWAPCLDEFGLEVKDANTNELRVKVYKEGNNKGKTISTEFDKFKKFMGLEFLGGVSLNRITVTVDGVMTVDVNTVAARIDEVEIDKVTDCGDTGNECVWTDVGAGGGVRTGVIRGAYMKGGDIAIAEKDALHIDELQKVEEGSNDEELHFSFKLTAPIPNQTKLHFTVTKAPPSADTKKLESNSYEYLVAYSPTAPGIDSLNLSSDKKTLTVRVRRLNSAAVTFSLHSEAGEDVPVPDASVTMDATDHNKFTLAIDGLSLKAGCWVVQAKSGGLSSNRSEKFAVEPKPTLDSAIRRDKSITVTGTDLIDFSHCGGQRITFKLLKEGTDAPTSVNVLNWNNGKPVLNLPDDVQKDSAWKGKVQVYLDDTKQAEVDLQPGS
ncbi:MAG: hypothetical protein QOH25_2208 [Acidobacteriota bacterium]|jgi:hypothetical protein|nr:hypothetical protein [Acidobacteriota bacterium]